MLGWLCFTCNISLLTYSPPTGHFSKVFLVFHSLFNFYSMGLVSSILVIEVGATRMMDEVRLIVIFLTFAKDFGFVIHKLLPAKTKSYTFKAQEIGYTDQSC